jgi:hypothetical protein
LFKPSNETTFQAVLEVGHSGIKEQAVVTIGSSGTQIVIKIDGNSSFTTRNYFATNGDLNEKWFVVTIEVDYLNNEAKFYLNGELVGTHDITGETNFYHVQGWFLGSFYNPTYTNPFRGSIAEHRFSNNVVRGEDWHKATYLTLFSKKIVYNTEEVKLYLDKVNDIVRTPITLCTITSGYCANIYGVAPCTANRGTGNECYNTYPTCQDKLNYIATTKDYKFSTQAAPLIDGYRPYLGSVNYMPTEIKPNKITVKARVKATMFDEEDNDVGIDPYRSNRSSIQGTYWKKYIARNPNYKNSRIKFSEGFDGLDESEFVDKFVGVLDNITINKASVTLEAVDLLTNLKNIKIPAKVSSKLKIDISTTVTSLGVTSTTNFDSPSGYIMINDEVMYYGSINTSTGFLTNITRGMFGTTAAEHSENDKVQKVKYYAPANPYAILLEMLQTDAGIDSSDIDITAFTTLQNDDPVEELDRYAVITEPENLDTLFFELVNELDCKCWVNEDLKITIKKNIYNIPSESYHSISDEANIIDRSAKVDLNEKSRFSRIVVYWDKDPASDLDDKSGYNSIDVFIDADSESDNEYGEVLEKDFFSRWLHSDVGVSEEEIDRYVINNFSRILFNIRDAQTIFEFDVEMKDMDIKTGDFTKISTGEIQDVFGNDLVNRVFQVIKRERKADGKFRLKNIITPSRKICFIAPDSTPDYTSASDAQKEYGFIAKGDYLNYTFPSGTFTEGETIMGYTSGATAVIGIDDTTNNILYVYAVTGTFQAETIIGSISGATATISGDVISGNNVMSDNSDGYRIF